MGIGMAHAAVKTPHSVLPEFMNDQILLHDIDNAYYV